MFDWFISHFTKFKYFYLVSWKTCPDCYCYISGFYILKKRENIANLVHKACLAYFGVKLEDQDKPWDPHITCHTCVSELRKFYHTKQTSLTFVVPALWLEQINHFDDCYLCLCQISGNSKKSKKHITYQNFPSAIRNGY